MTWRKRMYLKQHLLELGVRFQISVVWNEVLDEDCAHRDRLLSHLQRSEANFKHLKRGALALRATASSSVRFSS